MKDLETVHIPVALIDSEQVEMDEFITELSESIREQGLLNPISVQALNGETPRFKVIAGKKRLAACTLLGVGEVPCRVVKDVTDERFQLIQIEENLKRVNLPWWEISKLVSEWHVLRQAQLGESAPVKGKAKRENPGWSMRDTAEELKLSLGFISEAVMLDRAVQKDPTLRNIKDRDTAVRLVRSAAKRFEAQEYASMPVEFRVDQVYNGSSAEILKKFEQHSFDVCITDPPWLKYMDEKLIRDDETLPVFKEIYRVLRPDSLLYMFVGFDDFYSYTRHLPQMGFTVSKTPLLWIKRSIKDEKLHGVVLSKGARAWEYSRDFELILVAAKGSPVLVDSVQQSSIKLYAPIPPVSLVHPNEKPVDLLVDLLRDCTHEGSIVLDPFSGSGSTLLACKRTGRRYIGIERDHAFYENIKKRLSE